MLKYRRDLKEKARRLRSNLTDSEAALWSALRRQQILGVQFYRQKPIGDYIVDFFAPCARLVVEVDGSQHANAEHARRDEHRNRYLVSLGLKVMRFNSREVLKETAAVVESICQAVTTQIGTQASQIPPRPPLPKGGNTDKNG